MRYALFVLLIAALASCDLPWDNNKPEETFEERHAKNNWNDPPHDGRFEGFYDGIKVSEGVYKNRHRDGVWKYYTDSTRIEASYKQGAKDGEWKYYRDGRLVCTVVYRNDSVIDKLLPEVTGGRVHSTTKDMPVFVHKNIMDYIRQNTVYPLLAKDNGIQGTVYVEFVIDATGETKEVKVVRGAGQQLNTEAARVIRGMPRMFPGLMNGIPVSVRLTIPIKFTIR